MIVDCSVTHPPPSSTPHVTFIECKSSINSEQIMSRSNSIESCNSIGVSFKHSPSPYSDVLGARRTFAGLMSIEWIFLAVSTVNIAATIGITIERIITYSKSSGTPDFTFALLLLVNTLFCVFYVYNGVLRELTFEIIAFIGSIVLVLAYCVFEYCLNSEGRNTIKLVRLVASLVLAPLNIGLAVRVAWHFGWLEFNITGASEAMQIMYRQQRAFYSLQKFDFQAAVSFFILILEHGTNIVPNEKKILSVGLVVSFVWLIVGRVAVYIEGKWLVWGVGLFGFVEPTFVIAKIADTYVRQIHHISDIPGVILYPMLGVGAIAFIVRAMLLVELVIVYKNFNNGLGDEDRLVSSNPDINPSISRLARF